MPGTVAAMDVMIPDVQHAAAVIGLISAKGACLKPGSYRKRLNSRAWLISTADAEIIPEIIERLNFVLI